jgi:uncharacterized phiE125 gp8 family phage protein
MFSVEVETGPALEPLTIEEVKRDRRLDLTDGEPAPPLPTVALVAEAGNVDNGAHQWKITFQTADGETTGSPGSEVLTTDAGQGKADITLPIGGSLVTGRKVYRTAAGGSVFKLVATVADNTATTYQDNISDANLGADIPAINSTLDPQLTLLIENVRTQAEKHTGRALITQTLTYYPKAFPDSSGTGLIIPRAPLQSITSVKYIDTNGVLQTWDSAKYVVGTRPGREAILPAYGEGWPSVRTSGVLNPIEIEFIAGYGNPADVPAPIKQAMLAHLGFMYENREGFLLFGVPSSRIPDATLAVYKSYEIPY